VLPAETFASARTAEVRGFDAAEWLGPKGLRNFDRLTKFLITAAKLALEDAGVRAALEYALAREADPEARAGMERSREASE